jgi:hypothetical protein
VWSDGKLKIIPYADSPVTGHSVTYTPNVTPLYNLTDDDFIAAEGEDPVKVTRRPQSDVFNHIEVEFDNRSYQYNGDIAKTDDQNSVETYGLKPAPVIKAPFIKDPAVARFVAQLAVQRQVYIRNTYEFSLGFRYVLLEPMDLVTLTDSNLGLNQTTVRLTQVEEQEDGSFLCTAEEWPFGVATAALYGTGSTAGIPTPSAPAVPAFPGVTISFDATGQAILNLTGDGRTAKHIYVLRTDRLPTLAETRAGTAALFGSVSSIATGVIVAAGASVYVGDLAYNVSGGESPLTAAKFTREGSGTSAPPVALVTPLNTETDDTVWNYQFDALAGSGGGGANLTYDVRKKIGFVSESSLASGNATTLPRNLSVARDPRAGIDIRYIVTDTATGLASIAHLHVPPQRPEVNSGGHVSRGFPLDDGAFSGKALTDDGTQLDPAVAQQSAGTARAISKGYQRGTARDGDTVAFSPVYQNPPQVIISGGVLFDNALGTSALQYGDTAPVGLTASSFVVRAKIKTLGSITPRTAEFTASLTATSVGSVTGNAALANAPSNDSDYHARFGIDVVCQTISGPGTTTVVVAIEVSADGSTGWTEYATRSFTASRSTGGTTTTSYTGNDVVVNVGGLLGASGAAVRLKYKSKTQTGSSVGSATITGYNNTGGNGHGVTYNTSSGDTVNSKTPAASDSITWESFEVIS